MQIHRLNTVKKTSNIEYFRGFIVKSCVFEGGHRGASGGVLLSDWMGNLRAFCVCFLDIVSGAFWRHLGGSWLPLRPDFFFGRFF